VHDPVSDVLLLSCCLCIRPISWEHPQGCGLNCSYNVFLQHFGMNMMWFTYTPIYYGLGFRSRPSRFSFLRVLGGSRVEFRWWTPISVKLLLSPRHSRGISRHGLIIPTHRDTVPG
jgi:hypothetical protein